jgi:hypothetical protein
MNINTTTIACTGNARYDRTTNFILEKKSDSMHHVWLTGLVRCAG